MNIKDINLKTIKIEGISKRDYPDCVDSYCAYAEYKSGIPLNDIDLDIFNDQFSDVVQEMAREEIF